jgi:hypothetical protein
MRARAAYLLALAAAENLALTGCAPTWPDVRPAGQPWFLAGHGNVATIDLLPLDVAITSDGQRGAPEDIAPAFEAQMAAEIAGVLQSRGYQLGATIDWDGGYLRADGQPGLAMTRDEIGRTLASLASYGFAASRAPGLPPPFLPARLGAATGSDATLYVGGYAFSGDDPGGVDAGDVAKGVLIAVFIVVVVVVLVAASKHGGGGGSVVSGAGRAVAGAGRVAVHGVARLGHIVVHARRPLFDVVDVFGRATTHIDIYLEHADEVPLVPTRGDSQTLLEMTLVDNRTGQALWHARQRFPANPARRDHISQLVARVLSTLPPHRLDR